MIKEFRICADSNPEPCISCELQSFVQDRWFVFIVSVLDPDPDSIRSVDPDPDPGGQKWPTRVEKIKKLPINVEKVRYIF